MDSNIDKAAIRVKKNRKVFCPKCKSENIAPIIYGMPTYETFKRAEKGEFFLGGCEIMPCQPDYKCHDCSYSWAKEAPEAVTKR